MTIRNLDAGLVPKSVALIGASTRAGSVGLITARNMLAAGFGGPVWLVNPKHGAIEGSACHASLEALPGVPDLAVIATPPAAVPGIVAELGAKGGPRRRGHCAAGERGDLEQAMLDAAKPHLSASAATASASSAGIGLNASFAQLTPRAGDLAFVTQSGALVTAVARLGGAARHRLLAHRLARRHGRRRLRRPARLPGRRRQRRARSCSTSRASRRRASSCPPRASPRAPSR